MAPLTPAALEIFFRLLAERVPGRVKLILTGGAEALLLGSVRPTHDIDFGVAPFTAGEPGEQEWEAIEAAIASAAQEAQVAVQYSADIDRWSSIAMPDYRRHTRLYRRFGRVSVHLLEPAYWAVPKFARYYDSDAQDLQAVFRLQRVNSRQVTRVCGRALRISPRSTALYAFRTHVEHFLRTHGTAVWGGDFDPESAVRAFHRAAGIQL